MLTIYARTFMIATMTDAREQPAPAAGARPRGRRTWLGAAWRRLSAHVPSDASTMAADRLS
jgi:hypothetical protein